MARNRLTVTIDIGAVVKALAKKGQTREAVIQGRFDGWSNAVIDVLEERYNLETLLVNYISEGV